MIPFLYKINPTRVYMFLGTRIKVWKDLSIRLDAVESFPLLNIPYIIYIFNFKK